MHLHVPGPGLSSKDRLMATTPNDTRRAPRVNRRGPSPDSASAEAGQGELSVQVPLRDRPANENEPGTAAIISNLKRKPPLVPIYAAGAIAAFWAALTGTAYLPGIFSQSPILVVDLLKALALMALPGAVVMSAAYLLYRAQQLRQVSESLMHTAMRLVRPQDIAVDSLAAVALAIREEMNGLINGVENAMDRAGELEGMVHREISAIERAFGGNEERIRNLIAGLENQRIALQQAGYVIGTETSPILNRLEQSTHNLDQIIQIAQSALGSLEVGLKTSSNELHRTIEDAVVRGTLVGEDLDTQTRRMEETSAALMNGIDTFRLHIDSQVQTLARTSTDLSTESRGFGEAVLGMENNLVSSLRNSVGELSSLHSEVTRTVSRLTETLSDQIKTSGSQVSELMQSTSGNITHQLQNTSQEAARQIETNGEQVIQKIQFAGEMLSEKMHYVSADFMGNVTRARDEIFNFMEEAGNNMTGHLSASAGEILGRIEKTSGEISNRISSGTQSFAASVEHSAADIAALLSQTAATLQNRADENVGHVASLMSATAADIAGRLDQSGVSVSGLLTGTAEETVGRIEQSSLAVGTLLSGISDEVAGRVEKSARNVSTALGETANQVTGRIEQSAEAVNASLTSTSSLVINRMKLASENAVAQVASVADGLTERMTDATAGLTEALSGAADTIAARIGDAAATVSADVQNVADLAASGLSNSTQETVAGMAGTVERLTQQVGEASRTTLERLDEVSGDITERLDAAGNTMFERLESTARVLGSNFDEAAEMLNGITTDIAARMDGSSAAFSAKLDDASAAIRSNLDRAGSAFSQELEASITAMSGTFRGTTVELLSRLEEQGRALQDTGSSALTKLDDASSRFATHVRETNSFFTTQLSEAASMLDERLESTGTSLTQRLEEAAGSITGRLEDVTGIVDRAVQGLNLEIERMLVSREDALSDLVDRLGKRSGDVEDMMRSYLSAIEEQLAAAESRSSEIGRLVSMQAEETANGLDAQIRRLEELADAKITAAARQLRSSYENAVSTMNEMLALSAGEFTQTAQGMRATAEQVVRDIDSAREELGGAIANLPEETRANADAMRQVVADQISALQALADLVKRQAGASALSLPERREMPAPAAQPLAALRKAPAIKRGETANRSKLPEAARSLVEAMEGSLPRDLERRFQAGEDGVYLRRLVNSRSRKLQEALAQRYETERTLRNRMDEYVNEFERLLDGLATGPDSEEQVETALGSDAGKLFVLLAQASGRMPATPGIA